jgi:dephospho-CoA kinase
MQHSSSAPRNLYLGLTGGIASGKSSVAEMLRERGAEIIDFDLLARQVVQPGSPALGEIAAFFGSDVLRPDGSLDRKKLAAIVFADPQKREQLESFTHPRIRQKYLERVAELEKGPGGRVVVAVVPLLIETGMQEMFDEIVLVHLCQQEQVNRLQARDDIGEERARQVLAAQLPSEKKKAYADHVIDNSGTPEQTASQVEALWQKLGDDLPPRV